MTDPTRQPSLKPGLSHPGAYRANAVPEWLLPPEGAGDLARSLILRALKTPDAYSLNEDDARDLRRRRYRANRLVHDYGLRAEYIYDLAARLDVGAFLLGGHLAACETVDRLHNRDELRLHAGNLVDKIWPRGADHDRTRLQGRVPPAETGAIIRLTAEADLAAPLKHQLRRLAALGDNTGGWRYRLHGLIRHLAHTRGHDVDARLHAALAAASTHACTGSSTP